MRNIHFLRIAGMLALIALLAMPLASVATENASGLTLLSTPLPLETQTPVATEAPPVQLYAVESPLPTVTPAPVEAAADPAVTAAGKTPFMLRLFREDQKLGMPKNSLSYWFIVPHGLSLVDQCTLTLHITYSETFIEELSSITVYINDIPLATRKTVEEGTQEFTWEIPFDTSRIRTDGYNEIKFISVQRSIEGECADIDNPTNWMILHKDSKLTVLLEPAKAPAIRDYLPLYYDTFSEPFTLANDFVLSSLTDIPVVETMLGMSNAAGMYYADKEYLQAKVSDPADALDTPGNRIFVGSAEPPKTWDNALVNLPVKPIPLDSAFISTRGFTEQYPFYKLLVLGYDRVGLNKAAKYFNNRDILEQTAEDTLLLQSDIDTKAIRAAAKLTDTGLYSFEDFGLKDISLAGAFHQRAELTFLQPEGVRGEAGSYLSLKYRHSAALLSDRSLLSVSIDNIPVTSVKLSPQNAGGGTLMVDIPPEALLNPELKVTIECYHYLGKVDCTKDYYDVAWTVLDAKESKIFFKAGTSMIKPTLRNFPYFYPSEDAEVSLYLPGTLDKNLLSIASMLSTRAGQNTGSAFTWNVINGTVLEQAKGDIVLIAERGSTMLPPDITKELAIVPSPTSYTVQASLPVIPETLENKVIFQAIRSPWQANKMIYVVLYDGEQSLGYLSALLQEKTKLNQLKEQICIVGKDSYVQAFSSTAPEAVRQTAPATVTEYVKQVESYTDMPWWLLCILAVAVLIVILAIIAVLRQRRRGNQYRQTGEKHKQAQGFAPQRPNSGNTNPDDPDDQ